MSDQLSLFDSSGAAAVSVPSVVSSETSRAAAAAIRPAVSEIQRRIMLAVIGSADGLTDGELQRHLSLSGDTERPRRVDLVRRGFLADSGEKRESKPGSSRLAVVWAWTGKELG